MNQLFKLPRLMITAISLGGNMGPHKYRVLIVDDECTIADSLALILRREGYEVLPAYDGESAWFIVQTFVPDVIITDVFMPGISGITLAIRISECFPACRILLCSGQPNVHRLMCEARAKGHMFELLQKPMRPTDLLERLSDLLPSSSRSTVNVKRVSKLRPAARCL